MNNSNRNGAAVHNRLATQPLTMKTLSSLTLLSTVLLAFATLPASAYYDPGLQRWLNRDPIQEAGGMNLFSLCENEPVSALDALGLDGPGIPWPGYPTKPPPPGWPGKPPPGIVKGFSICQRDLAKDGSCDCGASVGNAFGGEHTYLQFVDPDGNNWGYGWGGAHTKPGPEGHFHPNSCKACSKGAGSLQYGSGSGKAGNTASDADIKDCITKVPPSKDYSKFGYNCKSWAKEAAAKCGLDCN